ncbi:TFIID-18kDa-domain-containing protein [Aulographum hederae CBS 113979]|uniref:Transcription initiation factor TFIID subunit 13 n=1 Tax=Aulographum hederae CBS 113979 TaxID=1176131 RepID=A0A6G1H4H6_9PEZI|nr:TFIID-18kDa-domain-containing protein [Aulographum hederae CBS 113979]
MTEPRQRPRKTGSQFPPGELANYLYAFGDPGPPLANTIETLDAIVTDFIIEVCHSAAECATYSRRQKIKVDDFRWALRKDSVKYSRAMELIQKEKVMKEARRAFNTDKEQAETLKAEQREEKAKQRLAAKKRKKGIEEEDEDEDEDDEERENETEQTAQGGKKKRRSKKGRSSGEKQKSTRKSFFDDDSDGDPGPLE